MKLIGQHLVPQRRGKDQYLCATPAMLPVTRVPCHRSGTLTTGTCSLSTPLKPSWNLAPTRHRIRSDSTCSNTPSDGVGSPAFLAVNHYGPRSEEHTSELQSRGHLVCRLLLE